jgi:DNA-binding FadR family transcriptional regulator
MVTESGPNHDDSPSARPRVSIEPVDIPKPAEVFAEILRTKIFNGDFPAGEALPPERVLVEQSHLSRASIREALRILKQQGLITTRAGRNGGSIVTRPTEDDLINSLDVYLLSKGWGPDNPTLVEIREIIEPWCAGLAASRRTSEDLEKISLCHEATVTELDNVTAYTKASQEWHFAIADASHNALLAALMRVRSDAVLSAAHRSRYSSRSARQATIEKHSSITEEIQNQNSQRAYSQMASHVRNSNVQLPDFLVDDPITSGTSVLQIHRPEHYDVMCTTESGPRPS